MAYQPYRSTLQVRFYGLWLEVLRHPQRATGRNHIKRLKMCLGEAGGSTLAHFLARVLLNVEPAGSPARIHEFPEGPLEVSVYFPKASANPKHGKILKETKPSMTEKLYKDIAVASVRYFSNSSSTAEKYTALLPLCTLVEGCNFFSRLSQLKSLLKVVAFSSTC